MKKINSIRDIIKKRSPYIIAEVGVNHEGSFDQARKLIDLAKEGGADAVKFQSYKAEKLASKKSPAYWDLEEESTKSQYELFKKYDSFDKEQYIELSSYCRKIGIDFLSTPFDDESVDFLDPLMFFYKIASADLTNLPFLRKIAKKGKPIVLSTGASTLEEIDIALRVLKDEGCKDVSLLHCILNYPTKNKNAHLRMISNLKEIYPEHVIGYSDHTLPDKEMTSLLTAYLLGADIIEKHFTHNKSLPGNDHYHSMDVEDLSRFKSIVQRISELKGSKETKEPIESEKTSRENARRSIVLKKGVRKGDKLSEFNLTYKRPGTGISPLHWDDVVGKRAARDLEFDDILQWQDIE